MRYEQLGAQASTYIVDFSALQSIFSGSLNDRSVFYLGPRNHANCGAATQKTGESIAFEDLQKPEFGITLNYLTALIVPLENGASIGRANNCTSQSSWPV